MRYVSRALPNEEIFPLQVVCLDLEGVLVPEIWIALAESSGIDELLLTTRDIPDYDELGAGRRLPVRARCPNQRA